jgi:ribosomal protein S3
LIRYYFAKFKKQNRINGISIICSGRWLKTRTGRKQKLKVTIGKIRKQTYRYNVDYDLTSLTSKHGTFSVKVWISYRD